MAEAQKKRGRPSKKQAEEVAPVEDLESDEAEVSDEPEAKKGRGKPKSPVKAAPAVSDPPKRGRGRPKSTKPLKAKKPTVPGRGRGRPPKNPAPSN